MRNLPEPRSDEELAQLGELLLNRISDEAGEKIAEADGDDEIPSAEQPSMAQLQLRKRQALQRDHRIANSADVSQGQMLLLKPERMRGAKVRWSKARLL